ncbi:GEVED domain-containing protein [Blastopirellula sp. J2-11]|uniref:GEVED domain-containing protein n=1 Tax=Blastopirellula sp. J2-11 TaxID=2943192 RepID=UPI0021C5ADEF|nr:GEVED domain-containing protein [Blastopirellula sp. J2-11]UUO08812.1 GEVED domain-containing protein [Blastopirellula sp. J2-11]
MTIRYTRRRTSAQRKAALKNHLRSKRKGAPRSLNHEQLESRQLMAGDVFQLIGIQNNNGDLLDDLEVLNSAPHNLTLRFDENHAVDPATLADGIRIYRAGANSILGDADDVDILGNGADFGGFIGIGDSSNEVVIRFGEALLDDQYRIEITSSLMGTPLTDGAPTPGGMPTAATPFSSTFELNLGAQILSIVPQPVTRNETTGALEIARDQIYIYMNDDDLDMASVLDPGYYQLLFQRTDDDNPDIQNGEVAFFPTSVDYDADSDLIILKFAKDLDTLPGDLTGFVDPSKPTVFRLQIGSKEITSKEWTDTPDVDTIDAIGPNDPGDTFDSAKDLVGPNNESLLDGNHEFEVTRPAHATHLTSTGATVYDVVGQIFTINDGSDANNGVGNSLTFQLIDGGTTSNPFYVAIDIHDLIIDPASTRAMLADRIAMRITTAFAAEGLVVNVDEPTSSISGTRFALSSPDGRPTMLVSDTTVGLIVDRSQTVVIHGQIINEAGEEYALDLPGASDEPGHREDYAEQQEHLLGSADDHSGITEIRYTFPQQYGVDPAKGTPLFNQITEAQKQRTREIMALYSYYAGVTFVEVPYYEPDSPFFQEYDLRVVTGDLRAVQANVPTGPGGVAGIAGGDLVVMDIFDHQDAGDDEYGGDWQSTAIHEIGHFLGLGHSYELPPLTTQSGGANNFGLGAENIFPGDNDIVHMQHLYNPESKDIDLYKLEITETGRLTAEILAERLSNLDPSNPRDPSSLDALITIYQENGDGTRTVIARNDDYYSEDPFVELLLQQGTYYIGVSASGNNAYDPSIADSGFGGKTQGDYDLQIRFRPDSTNSIRDTGAVLESGTSILVRNAAEDFGTDAQRSQSGLHTITLIDGNGTSVTYELDFVDTPGVPATVQANNVAVQVLNSALASDIVDALVTAINGTSNFAIIATNVGNRIDLANAASNNPVDFSSLIDANDTMRITGGASEGAAIDGDLNGAVGGNYNFWFRAETPLEATTPSSELDQPLVIYVDKTSTRGGQNNPALDGSLQRPFNNIQAALTLADQRGMGDVIRIIGLAGNSDDPTTLADNLAYYIGYDTTAGQVLEDGQQLIIPKDVTVMIDEGAILKFGVGGAVVVGSTSVNEDRSFAALQVLGIPERFDPYVNSSDAIVEDVDRAGRRVIFTSYNEENVGTKSNTQFDPEGGDWGGVFFNNEVDREENHGNWQDNGIFLNSIVGGDFRYGGGIASINGEDFTLAPVYMEETRPALYFNNIVGSAGAAFSADPNSFEKTNFQVYSPKSDFNLSDSYRIGQFNQATPDYTRSGPAIFGNDFVTKALVTTDDTGAVITTLREGYDTNSLNGILVRINTPAGNLTEKLTVTANFDDTDIVHVLLENLLIEGTPGGLLVDPFGTLTARLDAGLVIDPNIVMKSNGSRIEVQMGASLIAEASSGNEIIFTSLHDDRYGFGGTFDTNGNGFATTAAAGDWSGIYFGQTSTGSLDSVILAYGGGNSRVDGGLAFFNAIEVHQATVRVAHSLLEENADGRGTNDPGPTRAGHSANAGGTIFVAGAQPVIVNNNFRNNEDASVNINVNSLNSNLVVDWGRSTGLVDVTPGVGDNQGALIRFNLQTNNGVNGMVVRGGVLTTQSVWDDTDIVHVLFSEVVIPDLHTYGGLRIESSTQESLVVKLMGAENAGITASGRPLDIEDRIGGMLQVIGQPGFPVVFTSFYDDTVGAGFDENGNSAVDTDNTGDATAPAPGDWRSLLIDQFANDRNVEVIVEAESNNAVSVGTNGTPQSAQAIGILAPDEYAGDDNRRLGFEIQGYLSSPSDVDVYAFQATPGTEVWLDLDRTTMALDAIIELIDDNGNVIARSLDNNTLFGNNDASNQMNTMPKSGTYDQDRWTINPRDASMRIVLPGNPTSSVRTYHVRIRSNGDDIGTTTNSSGSYLVNQEQLTGGLTSGVYQLQIRLREVDEFGGSTIKQADVRYATNGIEVLGQPAHSPLLGESAEDGVDTNNSQNSAHNVGNVLTTDRDAISIAAEIASDTDVDWFEFELTRDFLQSIEGFSADEVFASLMIDLDYMGGARGNAQIAVYDASGQLVLVSSDSGVNDDQTQTQFVANTTYDPDYTSLADLERGSLSTNDPYIGTINIPQGTYYVAVSSTAQISNQLSQFYEENPTNSLVRLEPVDSIQRIVEEHIGTSTFSTADAPDIAAFLRDPEQAKDYHLSDMVMFVSVAVGVERTQVWAVNPFTGAVEAYVGEFNQAVGDIGMRPDGSLFAYSQDNTGPNAPAANANGNFLQIDTGTGASTIVRDDGVQTYVLDKNGNPVVDNKGNGFGYDYNALAYGYLSANPSAQSIRGYAVGNYAGGAGGPGSASTDGTNILFRVDASDTDGNSTPLGVAVDADGDPNKGANNDTNEDRAIRDSGTDVEAVGQIRTDFDFVTPGSSIIIVNPVSTFDANGAVLSNYEDGDTFVIDGDGNAATLGDRITVELNLGYDLSFTPLNRQTTTTTFQGTTLTRRSGGTFPTDGSTFVVDGVTYELDLDQYIDFGSVGGLLATNDEGSAIQIVDDTTGTSLFLYLEDTADGSTTDGINSATLGAAPSDTVVAVQYTAGVTTREILLQSVLKAITDNAATAGPAYRLNDTIVVSNDSSIALLPGLADTAPIFGGVTISGGDGAIGTNVVVSVDPGANEEEIATAVAAAINGQAAGTASQFGTRVTVNATTADFTGIGTLATAQANVTTGAGNVMVNIGADSDAKAVADAIAAAVNTEATFVADSAAPGRVHFTYNGTNATVEAAAGLFQIGGEASGGTVTGLAIQNTDLYAVDDNGGVFRVNLTNPTQSDFLGIINDVNGNPVEFVSLEAAPASMQEAASEYGNILFGMSSAGVMYAIAIQELGTYDEADLAPIFVGGRTSIATALNVLDDNPNIGGSINGIAMGTLSRNLWNLTNTRSGDAGHGIEVPVTGWRDAEGGGVSFYFGNEDKTFAENAAYGNATSDNYDFPQGAHGTLITEDFSLKGYDAADMPVLYFNYYSETDNVNGDLARDTFRVFVAGDDGNWVQVTTNNNYNTGGGNNDEFDAQDKETLEDRAVSTPEATNGATNAVQPTYDNTNSWRQARVDLSQFAGQDNLKLRFDFATGGQINIGGVAVDEQTGANFAANTTDVRALDSNKHEDGEVFSVTDPYTGEVFYFEINKGQTLTVGSYAQFVDGDTFAITANGMTRTFEFDTGDGNTTADNMISISLSDTPNSIAEAVRNAINDDAAIGSIVRTFRDGNELTIRDIDDIGRSTEPNGLTVVTDGGGSITGLQIAGTEEGRATTSSLLDLDNPTIDPITGLPIFTPGMYDLHTIDIHDDLFVTVAPNADGEQRISDIQLAQIMQVRMQQAIAADTVDMNEDIIYTLIPQHEEFLYLLGGYQLTRYVDGDNGAISHLGFDANLQSDTFGVMQDFPTTVNTDNGLPNVFDTRKAFNQSNERGVDNARQGIFIDDLIIGFAERGEMVTGASINGTGFETNPNALLIDVFVGEYQLELREGTEYVFAGGSYSSERIAVYTWDTNDRLLDGHSIIAPAGKDIQNNTLLEVSDGVDTIVFRFWDLDQEETIPTYLQDRGTDTKLGVYTIGYRSTMTQGDIARALSTAINDTVGQVARRLTESTRTFGVIARVNSTLAVDATSGRIDLSPKSPYSDEVIVGLLGTTNLGALRFSENGNDTFLGATNTKLDSIRFNGYMEFHARGQIGDNPVVVDGTDPPVNGDVDMYNVDLGLGSTLQVDVESLSLGSPVGSLIRLFYIDGTEVVSAVAGVDPTLSYTVSDPLMAGRYFIAISHEDNDNYDPAVPADDLANMPLEKIEYALTVSVDNDSPNPFQFVTYADDGDQNNFRDQGQIIISSNRVSNSSEWGVLVDAAPRGLAADGGDNLPHQGAVRVTREINTNRLTTGVTIVNNIIYDNGTGAILFSGDAAPTSQTPGSVSVGRIINNTLYGVGAGDVGIQVNNQAGPSIVNNIIANFATGIDVAADGVSPVQTRISRTLFQGNGADSASGDTGQSPILLAAAAPLFVDAANGNFYLSSGSQAIDAAIDSVPDRAEFNSLNSPLGIATSPVIAPARDQSGQLRYDDPTVVSSGGSGVSGFKDIGALDRADTRGPGGKLIDPQDNDAANLDLDQTQDVVQLLNGPLTNISIQLIDSSGLSSQPQGSGIDDTTVTGDSIIVQRISGNSETTLAEGVDYRFDYDATNNVIRITPVSGIFEEGVTYKILLKNRYTIDPDTGMALGVDHPDLISDNAGNSIEPNKFTGNETSFFIRVGGLLDFGDAPESYGTLIENNGARHGIREDFFLGESIDSELNGKPSDGAEDDNFDDGIVFEETSLAGTGVIRSGGSSVIYVEATVPLNETNYGFIQAWLDYNGDGVFDDEEMVLNRALNVNATNGANLGLGQKFIIDSDMPNAVSGQTYMRFRYSSTGGLAATGLAEDGEVEDYEVTIEAAPFNPWHNSTLPEAVTVGDSIVSSHDLAAILREIQRRDYTDPVTEKFKPEYDPFNPTMPFIGIGGVQGVVPNYLDVDNDGRVSELDYQAVLEYFGRNQVQLNPEFVEDALLSSSSEIVNPAVENTPLIDSSTSSVQIVTTDAPSYTMTSTPLTASSAAISSNPTSQPTIDLFGLSIQQSKSNVTTLSQSTSTTTSYNDVDESFTDEVLLDDSLDAVLLSVANDVDDAWRIDTDESDDMDDLIALISQDEE